MDAPDENLKPFCTPLQWSYIKAAAKFGGPTEAARKLGKSQSTISKAINTAKQRAALSGYSPDHGWDTPTPEGYMVSGMSTLYDARTGAAKLRWEKVSHDKQTQLRLMQEAVEAFADSVPKTKATKPPKQTIADLCNVYVITDYHYGMMAWAPEAGETWNIETAHTTLINCYNQMLASSPNASMGILAQLGDMLHTDSMVPATPTSGHILDQDTRYQNIVRNVIHTLRCIVDMMLKKHDTVHVIQGEGNHDISSSVWLREMFASFYENEPRVTVDTNPLPYYAYQFGDVMLAFHHGHLRKPKDLASVFAAQYPQMWGKTSHRYAHCGHLHHKVEVENAGMTVTQHRTLSPKDSYAARGGYHSIRAAECRTYSRKHGEVGTTTVTPGMIDV
tara:strand:- start:2612 stop:3781 length:1170 start_codon:yes stop_codon:yes gene_type:complete